MAQIIKADMDEMVFEDRERNYGAYYLRKKYPNHLTIGTIIVSIISILVLFGPIIAQRLHLFEKEEKAKTMAVTINMEDLPPPPPVDEEQPPPPPPPDQPPPEVAQVAFQIPEPTPEEELEDPEQTITEMEKLEEAPSIGLEDKEGADEGFFTGEVGDGDIPEVIVDNEPEIDAFVFAEEEPKPVNLDDIKKLVGYPQIARDAGIQGTVVVRVLVDKKGNYGKHRIISQAHPVLAKAVEEHLAKLKFTPAIQGGKPIQFWVNIPFNFKLLE
ncbi:MAG: energy transducer TonB [Bacteroidetes bacterium]|nr:MAG: energy transducer TonB [Bacteroidota bacterium]